VLAGGLGQECGKKSVPSSLRTTNLVLAFMRPGLRCRFLSTPLRIIMSRSNRGAAQVSLMWVIALAVISLVAFLFAFMSQQKLVDVQVVNDALRAETAEAKALFEVESDKGLKISKSVGYQGADGSMTSVDTVKAATTELQAVFALEGNLRDLSAAVPGVIGKYNA